MAIFVVLKLVHIISGIVWLGANFMMVLFIMPSAKKMGPDGGKFMQQFTRTNNFPAVINISAILTILSGSYIYWIVSGGLAADWLKSGYGISLSFGVLLTLIGYCVGVFVQRPNALKIAELGKAISASGGSPPEGLMDEMATRQRTLENAARITTILITTSVISMPISRFIVI